MAAVVVQGEPVRAVKERRNEGAPVTRAAVEIDAVAEMGGAVERGMAMDHESAEITVMVEKAVRGSR